MSARAEALAQDFEAAITDLEKAIQACPDEQWKAASADEGWTVAASAHHVGHQFELEMEYLTAHAAGRPLPSYTWDDVHKRNNGHAVEFANCTRDDAIKILRDGSVGVRAFIRGLSDEQLDRQAPLPLADGAEVTLQQLLEGGVLIDHVRSHTKSLSGAG